MNSNLRLLAEKQKEGVSAQLKDGILDMGIRLKKADSRFWILVIIEKQYGK